MLALFLRDNVLGVADDFITDAQLLGQGERLRLLDLDLQLLLVVLVLIVQILLSQDVLPEE